jgi:16S rRNA (cytidine(1402)-2'-O)-methyltransferase
MPKNGIIRSAVRYIVATPIGNLGDMTIRGIETLAAADIIACEDTRVSRVLLERYGISRRPYAYHEHNATEAGPKLIEALLGGKSVALISDAGTPLVSDPGGRLVPEAKAAGIRVVPALLPYWRHSPHPVCSRTASTSPAFFRRNRGSAGRNSSS